MQSLKQLKITKVTAVVACLFFSFILTGCHYKLLGVLNPKGTVAYQERQLLFDTMALMLIVVIPVIVMSFAFVFRYRASHKTADYKPNWSHSVFLETIWWGVPCVIIFILGIMTWKSTHKLDPYKRIKPTGQPLLVQAVALPWKWLFIYPKQNIASVNYLVMPKNREVAFRFTSDNVPMSAFFVPQLGSQIYVMAGMQTQLHLLAKHLGVFPGLNTHYNGEGFSDMHFNVRVTQPADFNQWVRTVKTKSHMLDNKRYTKLLKPSIRAPIEYYSAVEPGLFKKIILSFRKPDRGHKPLFKDIKE